VSSIAPPSAMPALAKNMAVVFEVLADDFWAGFPSSGFSLASAAAAIQLRPHPGRMPTAGRRRRGRDGERHADQLGLHRVGVRCSVSSAYRGLRPAARSQSSSWASVRWFRTLRVVAAAVLFRHAGRSVATASQFAQPGAKPKSLE